MGHYLPINGIYWGYNPLTNHLLTSWDIQVGTFTAHTDQFARIVWGDSRCFKEPALRIRFPPLKKCRHFEDPQKIPLRHRGFSTLPFEGPRILRVTPITSHLYLDLLVWCLEKITNIPQMVVYCWFTMVESKTSFKKPGIPYAKGVAKLIQIRCMLRCLCVVVPLPQNKQFAPGQVAFPRRPSSNPSLCLKSWLVNLAPPNVPHPQK